jgi:hypothetical protein
VTALKRLREARALPGYERNGELMAAWHRTAQRSSRVGLRGAWLVRKVESTGYAPSELEARELTDWDEAARPYLKMFLTLHTPAANLLEKLTFRSRKPRWSDVDFTQLLTTMGAAGFGWLRPQGVQRKLEEMAVHWQAAEG